MELPRTAFNCDAVNPVFMVTDIHEATAFYRDKLGFRLDWTWGEPKTYAGMTLGNISIHLLKAEKRIGMTHAVFSVDDADGLYNFQKNNGVKIVEEIANREYNMRDFCVQDPDGNTLSFGRYVMPTEPKMKIERVDVPVRLEKRLAALLTELATFKGLSLNSTLEETLLHTMEPLGDGVASPHTKLDLQKIQELKKKHGIDYDTHASYRFEE